MLEAFALGLASQSSLLASGLLASWVRVPQRIVGWLAAFGAGALISALTFDLTVQAHALGGSTLSLWLLIGAAVFIGGDFLVERRFGSEGPTAPLGIVLGSVVDGIPESLILGIGAATGNIGGPAFIVAVWVSNIPQALAPSADLVATGWTRAQLALMWGAVVVACGVAAAIGYLVVSIDAAFTGDRAAALAAGGLLAMLTNSLIPFAFQRGGLLAGVWTVIGFAAAVALL
jgi:ZIP family zinc transporter